MTRLMKMRRDHEREELKRQEDMYARDSPSGRYVVLYVVAVVFPTISIERFFSFDRLRTVVSHTPL